MMSFERDADGSLVWSSMGRYSKIALLFALLMAMELVRELGRPEGFSLLRVLKLANFKEASAALMQGKLPAMPPAEAEMPRVDTSDADIRVAQDAERANELMRLRRAKRPAKEARE